MKTQKLPTFDSMQQASTVSGVPLPAMRRAKRNGSPGFAHGRVDLKPVLQWLFTSGASAVKLTPFENLAAARARREEHRLLVEQNEFFDKNEVTEYIQKTFMPVREWAMRLPGDLAPQVNPGDPTFAQIILEKWAEDFLKHCRDAVPQKPPGGNNSDSSKIPDDELYEPQTGNQKIT